MTVTGAPLSSFPTLTCHCTSCKRRGGGIASYAFVVPKQHVSFSPAPTGGLGIVDPTTKEPTKVTVGAAAGDGAVDGSSSGGGSHKVFVDRNTGSGHPMQRSLCAECGSPVCIVEAEDPDARCLQYGLFADSEGVDLSACRPRLELFASRRVSWMPEVGEDVREKA